MWVISLPLSLPIGKKAFYLNLNGYRNAHFHELNKAKVLFKDHVTPLLAGIPKQQAIRLRYDFYAPTMARRDLMNVIAVVDKFFSDVLPEVGIVDDDHTGIIPEVHCHARGLDKANPRVDVTITPWSEPEEPTEEGDRQMSLQLTIGETVIKAAVWAYLSARPQEALEHMVMTAGRSGNGFTMGLSYPEDVILAAISETCQAQLPGLDLSVTLHATRGDEGYTATIEAGLTLSAEKILQGLAAPLVATGAQEQPVHQDEQDPEEPIKVRPVTSTPRPIAKATVPVFKKPRAVVQPEPEPEPELDQDEGQEEIELEGSQLDPDEDLTGLGSGSNLEDPDDDYEGGLPPETPSGITNASADEDEADRQEAPSLFRRKSPGGFGKPSASGPAATAGAGTEGEPRKRNTLFGRTARPDNSHLNQDG